MAKELILLFDTLFSLYIQSLFYSKHEKNFTKPKRVILYVVCGIVLFLGSHLVFEQSPYVMVVSLFELLLFSAIYKAKLFMRVVRTVVIYIIMGFSELVVGMVLGLFGIDISVSHSDMFIYGISTLVSKMIAFVIARLSRDFVQKEAKTGISFIYTLPMPTASIITLLLLLNTVFTIDTFWFKLLATLTSVFMIIANISIFYFIDKQNDYIESKERLLITENHLQTQRAHYEALYEHQNELRAFRHDSKNQMISLIGLVENGDADKALQEMKLSLDILGEKVIINSGNPVIDSILQAKTNVAKEHNIEIKNAIKITDKIEINEIELGILLGNIIDNAIEATRQVETDKREPIQVKIITMQGHISVHVINSVAADIDITNLKTIKRDKRNHGYGIKIVKSIAERNGGGVEFRCDKGLFHVRVNMVNRTKIQKSV